MKLENLAPWYVTKRGNLLAQEFLFELEPKQVVYTGDEKESPFDYLTLFTKEDGSLATLKKSNIPVLILVIDVKRNHCFFGWATEDFSSPSFSLDKLQKRGLRPAIPEEMEKLKQEIMALA
jgi:hypothetical protein